MKPGPSCEWQTLAQQNGRAWLVQREFKTSIGLTTKPKDQGCLDPLTRWPAETRR